MTTMTPENAATETEVAQGVLAWPTMTDEEFVNWEMDNIDSLLAKMEQKLQGVDTNLTP